MRYGLNFLYLLALATYLLAYLTDRNIFPRPAAGSGNAIA